MATLWHHYGCTMASPWERLGKGEGLRVCARNEGMKAKNLCYLWNLCDHKNIR